MPDDAYPEFVTSLFETRAPATIMSVLFLAVAGVVAVRSGDMAIAGLLAAGVIASAVRLMLLFEGRRRCDAGPLTPAAARAIERRFGVSYVAFAAVFGAFAARTLMLPLPALHLPMGILVVGYAAGVAATVSLRPVIAIPSLLVSVMPAVFVLGLGGGLEHLVSALCLAALLAGGLRSLSRRYASQTLRSARSRAYATLARHDHLTGLSNRLALTEAFETLAGTPMAVHYMDLDDFKLVNDHLGHPTGDALLRAVATRLLGDASAADIVVRLGGDEFVVVQTGVATPAQVADRAGHIEAVLGTPFLIDGRPIAIGVSVGSSGIATGGAGLEALLSEADDALRARKNERKRRRHRRAKPDSAGSRDAADGKRAADA